MGHEIIGHTADGRRTAVNPRLACGSCDSCDSCAAGRPQVCRRHELLGVHRPGGSAGQVAVPSSCLHDLPDGMPDSAAALIEPLANAVHVDALLPADIERIAVIGAVPIRLRCALVANRHGARVIVADSDHRRTNAHRVGLTVGESLAGEYDVVLDAVGLPGTRQASLAHLRPAGTPVRLGLAHDAAEAPGNSVVRGEQVIRGALAYAPDEFAEALALASGLDLPWATPVPLARAAEVSHSLADGDTEIVKGAIVPEAD